MHIVEGEIQPERLGDLPSAMWWAVVVMTKLGHTDVVPYTLLGKFMAAVVMLLGIGFFALPVAIIGRGFYEEIRRRDFVVTFSMVARVPLFSELEAATIAELVGLLKARKVAARTVIIRKGDDADAMYLIASGQVEVALDNGNVRLGDGDFFGEMALLSRGRRSATVVARRASELLVLDAEDFEQLLARNPEVARNVRRVAESRMGERRG
jgi:voltage-gated potassium channel